MKDLKEELDNLFKKKGSDKSISSTKKPKNNISKKRLKLTTRNSSKSKVRERKNSVSGIRQNILYSVKRRFAYNKSIKDPPRKTYFKSSYQTTRTKRDLNGKEKLRSDLKNSKIFSKIFQRNSQKSHHHSQKLSKTSRKKVPSFATKRVKKDQTRFPVSENRVMRQNFTSPRKKLYPRGQKPCSETSSKYLLGNTLNGLLETKSYHMIDNHSPKKEEKGYGFKSTTKHSLAKSGIDQATKKFRSVNEFTGQKRKMSKRSIETERITEPNLTEVETILQKDKGKIAEIEFNDNIGFVNRNIELESPEGSEKNEHLSEIAKRVKKVNMLLIVIRE
jgi:hypothetical protein